MAQLELSEIDYQIQVHVEDINQLLELIVDDSDCIYFSPAVDLDQAIELGRIAGAIEKLQQRALEIRSLYKS